MASRQDTCPARLPIPPEPPSVRDRHQGEAVKHDALVDLSVHVPDLSHLAGRWPGETRCVGGPVRSPRLGLSEAGRQDDPPAVVAAAQSDRILVAMALRPAVACQDDMGSCLRTAFLTRPDLDRTRLEAEAATIRLCQPSELRRRTTLLAFGVQARIRRRPVLAP